VSTPVRDEPAEMGPAAPTEVVVEPAALAEIEAELEQTRRQALSWKRLVIQAIGFALGAALIGWLLWRATRDPTVWDRLRAADPMLVAALLGCSVVSLVLNGAIFWISVRPVRHLAFGELQWVNATAALFNYAPVRLGVFVRIVWHLRIDRMRVREVAAWFASITYTVVVPLGAAITASLVFGRVGWPLVALAVALVVIGALVAPAIARQHIVASRCGGLERVVTDPRALWGALALRSIDIIFWSLRMMLTVRILGMELTAGQSFMLAMASLAITLNPLGRLGFREATVAFVAARMAAGDGDDFMARSSQLAVVESAGEFIVTLPAGILAMFMLSRRWKTGTRTTTRAPGA